MNLSIASIRIDGGTQPRSCCVCGFDFSPILHKHHIRPRSEGGANEPRNIAVLCPNCHMLVHEMYRWGAAKDLADFDRVNANYQILCNWIEAHLGIIALGTIKDIAMSRHYQKDKRDE